MVRTRWWMFLLAAAPVYGLCVFTGRGASAPARQVPDERPFTLKIVCGVRDAQPTLWEGSVRAMNAEIERMEGWRFLPAEDRVTGPGAWRLRTDAPVTGPNQPPAQGAEPNGILLFGTSRDDAAFEVSTNRGAFSFRLAELNLGAPALHLGGEVSVELLPAASKLTDDLREDDFASIAVAPDGVAWAVWQSYSGRSDEIRLRRFAEGRWHTFTRVPGISGDVWRPQVAIDANHVVWVVWSQPVDGNWDLYARAYDGQQWLPAARLTTDPLPDINHHVITDGGGNLCVVWQGFRARDAGSLTTAGRQAERLPHSGAQSDIFLKRYDHFERRWSDDVRVSEDTANDWDPAVAVDRRGSAWVVWDTYAAGNYDVLLRRVPLSTAGGLTGQSGGPSAPPLKVAATPQAEMRASVACDAADRVWVACEVARPNWGKDQGYTIRANPIGVPLGGTRDVAVRVVENGVVRQPTADPSAAMPEGERGFFFTPRLQADEGGRVWLAVRHKSVRRVRNAQGTVQQRNAWEEWLCRYDGDRWTPAIRMPGSAGRQSIYGDIAAGPDGTLWLTWTTDGRRYEDLHRPIHHEVYAAVMQVEGVAKTPALREPQAPVLPATDEPRLGAHADEVGDLNRIRAHRTRIRGREHRIVRGDLHRHTELSWDGGGGNDGSVLDFYRYMLDAAAMDFGAITDHNAGGDYEYWWWLTEKLADMYHVPGAYVSLFAYERSAVFPNGHRNIVHSYRGVPVVSFFTTPTLTGNRPGVGTGALLENDTRLLYEELRKSRGIAISHTSATRMGTDWRDNDRELEPVVEIFQGARTSYEYAGAPKSADPERDAAHIRQAGYQPEGFVWNAWQRGYRLGVITASDHGSTHMSYAMVFAREPTREGILDAIRRRHTYGATDNILLEFRIGEAFMGDEITLSGPPTLQVRVHGTNDLARIDLIRDREFLYTTEPRGREARLSYRDAKAPKGLSYYYVRAEQRDGQIAWSSPIWATVR